MKCFEICKCSDKQRQSCYVWRTFKDTPDDMDTIKCWVFKNVYEPENKSHLKKCLKCAYYQMMNQSTGVCATDDTPASIIRCEGVLNNEKSRGLSRTWEEVKEKTAYYAILDLSEVNNVYSCALGIIVKMHQEAKSHDGLLVIVGLTGYPKAIFDSTKLSRVVNSTETLDQAKQRISKAAHPASPEEKEKKKTVPPEQRPPCWEYWQNHNPKNATDCDECFHKQQHTTTPCWIVEGEIEGISFQYINEECEGCAYFKTYGSDSL